MSELLAAFGDDYTLRTVLAGSALIGITSGVLGSYAFLRRQSLLGDAVTHCTLPGIALAFLITGTKHPLALLTGGALSGWVGALAVSAIHRRSRISYDAALAMLLSVFFGVGLVLLTFIQKLPNAAQAGLETFLFGQAATLLARDVRTMAALGLVALLLVVALWKEWKLLVFDPEYAGSLGWRVRGLDVALITTLILAIVIGLQSVGVVLMSAMVVTPAAAARQWTDRFGTLLALAALIGASAGVTGTLISSSGEQLPTGPSIVVVAGVIVLFSIVFGRVHGVLWTWLRRRTRWRHIRAERLLQAIYEVAMQHPDPMRPMDRGLFERGPIGPSELGYLVRELERRGWIRRAGRERWTLTESGLIRAQRVFGPPRGEDRGR